MVTVQGNLVKTDSRLRIEKTISWPKRLIRSLILPYGQVILHTEVKIQLPKTNQQQQHPQKKEQSTHYNNLSYQPQYH